MALAPQGPSPPWVFIFLGPVPLKEAIKALRPGPVSPKDLKNSLARRNDPCLCPSKELAPVAALAWPQGKQGRVRRFPCETGRCPGYRQGEGTGLSGAASGHTQRISVSCCSPGFTHNNTMQRPHYQGLPSPPPPFTKEDTEAPGTCLAVVWLLRVSSGLPAPSGLCPRLPRSFHGSAPRPRLLTCGFHQDRGTLSPVPALKTLANRGFVLLNKVGHRAGGGALHALSMRQALRGFHFIPWPC